jgi:hypothetical protein
LNAWQQQNVDHVGGRYGEETMSASQKHDAAIADAKATFQR